MPNDSESCKCNAWFVDALDGLLVELANYIKHNMKHSWASHGPEYVWALYLSLGYEGIGTKRKV